MCCFCFCFVFVFLLPKIPPPLISNGAPLSLFYNTDDGGHYVIDNLELPCNSVKNLIQIWNFTNTFIQECKIIWEFQICWGGTSLLRPLWRSWRYLKAYSLMSNRGRFQKFKNLFFFSYFHSPLLKAQFPKGIRLKSFQYEMRAIFTESLGHETLFNTVVCGSNETHIIVDNSKT